MDVYIVIAALFIVSGIRHMSLINRIDAIEKNYIALYKDMHEINLFLRSTLKLSVPEETKKTTQQNCRQKLDEAFVESSAAWAAKKNKVWTPRTDKVIYCEMCKVPAHLCRTHTGDVTSCCAGEKEGQCDKIDG